jgi:hypothetical protein
MCRKCAKVDNAHREGRLDNNSGKDAQTPIKMCLDLATIGRV